MKHVVVDVAEEGGIHQIRERYGEVQRFSSAVIARTHVEFGSFFALLLGLGRPVRRLMWHHDAVAALRRRGRLQEPVESLLLTLLRYV